MLPADGEHRQPLSGAPAAETAAAEQRHVPYRPSATMAAFFASLDFNRIFATTFAFCFSMNEGMLIFAGFQAIAATFWVCSSVFYDDNWPSGSAVEVLCVVLLLCNAAIISYSVRRKSERGALALIASFSGTLLTLLAAFSASHPPNCDNDDVVDDKPLGAHTRTRTALSSLHVHSTCVLLLRVLQDRWCHTYCGPPTRACSCPSSAGSPPQPSAAARSTCGTCACAFGVCSALQPKTRAACAGPLPACLRASTGVQHAHQVPPAVAQQAAQ